VGGSREQPLPPSPSPLAERGRKGMLSDFLCKAIASLKIDAQRDNSGHAGRLITVRMLAEY
jgi:hypothetical protein